MGSRGASLKTGGFTEYNYKTIMRDGNVRFVIQKDSKSVKTPEMSNSKSAVYATLSKMGDIQSVTFYNSQRKLYRQIDFLHSHDGMKPHVHEIDTSSKNLRSGQTRDLKKSEKNKIEKIKRFYTKHNLKKHFWGTLWQKKKKKNMRSF